MDKQPIFRTDLYRGTAAFYDRYRLPYASLMLEDLATRARLDGTGRLLDVACGTGQVTFGIASRFSEVWAIDQEPEAIALARSKAQRLAVDNVRLITGRAEDLDVDHPFELVTVGNAFHRLDRPQIAARAMGWLQRGGHVAVLWSNGPWTGSRDWQHVMATVVRHWMITANAADRVPSNLNAALAVEPNSAVLTSAGLTLIGTFRFPTPHVWTVEALIGFMYSTSVLSRRALGSDTDAFELDLRRQLLELNPDGLFEEEIDFAYELARRP